MLLEGKTAIVTGALGDIGGEAVDSLISHGARVSLVDLDRMRLEEAVASRPSGTCIGIAADVRISADVQHYVAKTVKTFGSPIDIFFNNAGVEGAVAFLEDYPEDSFDAVMAVNVKGVFLGMKYVVPRMRKGGSIIITSSIMGLAASLKTVGYAASKHAVVGIMRSAAKSLAGRGIRVNTVHPGFVESRMMRRIEKRDSIEDPEAARLARLADIPLGRYVKPSEIAEAVLFLASDGSSMITGQTLVIDGGWLL